MYGCRLQSTTAALTNASDAGRDCCCVPVRYTTPCDSSAATLQLFRKVARDKGRY